VSATPRVMRIDVDWTTCDVCYFNGQRFERPESRKPREFWLTPATAFGTTLFASEHEPSVDLAAIHVREVLPE